jgi:hypothetical protein
MAQTENQILIGYAQGWKMGFYDSLEQVLTIKSSTWLRESICFHLFDKYVS